MKILFHIKEQIISVPLPSYRNDDTLLYFISLHLFRRELFGKIKFTGMESRDSVANVKVKWSQRLTLQLTRVWTSYPRGIKWQRLVVLSIFQNDGSYFERHIYLNSLSPLKRLRPFEQTLSIRILQFLTDFEEDIIKLYLKYGKIYLYTMFLLLSDCLTRKETVTMHSEDKTIILISKFLCTLNLFSQMRMRLPVVLSFFVFH